MSELELRLAWERFVDRSNSDRSHEAYDSVVSRHAEPHRHYHTAEHVAWVLRHLDGMTHPDIDHDLAAAAAFYHDAIYDPIRSDNEAASATLARDALSELGWPADRADGVATLIRATADHEPSDDITTAALCCADLGILSAAPTDYEDYVRQVRQEYGFVDDRGWRDGRSGVLGRFLARPAIFDARVAPADWEVRARANIAAELASLNA